MAGKNWVAPVSAVSLLLIAGLSQDVVANTFDLYKMVTCLNPTFKPTVIGLFYGCYCGPGGQGTPVDAIDACCQAHDNCYENFESKTSCMWFWPVISAVDYVCHNETKDITCRDTNLCTKTQCGCDSVLAKCLQNMTTPTSRPRCKDYNREQSKFDLSWLLH